MGKGNGSTRSASQSESPDFFLTSPEDYFVGKETDYTTDKFKEALNNMGDTMESFAWEHRSDEGKIVYHDRIAYNNDYISIDYGKNAKGLQEASIKAVGGEIKDVTDKKGNVTKRTFTPSYEVELGNVTHNPDSKDYEKFVDRYSKFHGRLHTKKFDSIEKAYGYIQQQRHILGKLRLD